MVRDVQSGVLMTRRFLLLLVGMAALLPGCGTNSPSRPLLFANPCPRPYDVALFNQVVGGMEMTRFTARPGLTPVPNVRLVDVTAAWSAELQVPNGSVRIPFEGWFRSDTVVIPALSCRPEDLRA